MEHACTLVPVDLHCVPGDKVAAFLMAPLWAKSPFTFPCAANLLLSMTSPAIGLAIVRFCCCCCCRCCCYCTVSFFVWPAVAPFCRLRPFVSVPSVPFTCRFVDVTTFSWSFAYNPACHVIATIATSHDKILTYLLIRLDLCIGWRLYHA